MSMEYGGGGASAGQMQSFVPDLQGLDAVKYRFTRGIGAIQFKDWVCYVVIYEEQVAMGGAPSANVATHVFVITPADLLRSAHYAIDFVLSLGTARLVRAIDLMVSRLLH